MKEVLVAAIGIWLVFVLVFASLVGAQTPTGLGAGLEGRPLPSPRSAGRQSADSVGRTVLLDDGPG